MTPMSRPKPSSSARLVLLLLSGTALAGLPAVSHAQTTWLGTASTNWFNGANWSTNIQPTLTTDAVIDTATPNPTVISGFNANAKTLIVGKTGGAALTIQGGGSLSVAGNVTLGQTLGSGGTMEVTGTGASFSITNSGNLWVGLGGDGALVILGGATATVNTVIIENQNGVIGLDGFGSSLTADAINVGQNGGGALNVRNESTVDTDFLEAGEGGVATVSNSGTHVTVNQRTNIGNDGAGQLILNQSATAQLDATYIGGDNNPTPNLIKPDSGTLAISTAATATSDSAEVGEFVNHTGVVTVDGTGSSWQITNGLTIGDVGGTGSLAVTGGGVVGAGQTIIGTGTGSTGTATVDGTQSSLPLTGALIIGTNGGTGSLTLTNGGTAHATETALGSGAGGSGILVVSGANSAYSTDVLETGVAGSGTLSVQTGAVVTVNNASIADDTGSTGGATVTGPGAALAVSQTLSIDSGTGTFSVLGGAHVSDNLGIVGQFNGVNATATVAGAGSQWTSQNTLSVAEAGTGALTITNGGVVGNVDSDLGGASTALGTVTVTGTGSLWNTTGQMLVGDQGTGSLSLANGATVMAGDLNAAQALGAHGTVSIDGAGSVLTVNGNFSDGARGFGTLTITNNGQLVDMAGFVAGGGGSTATATVSGANSSWVTSNQLTVGGGIGGGNSDGTLTVNAGALVLDGSAEIGGLVGSTGRVVVDGANTHWINANDVTIGDNGIGSLVLSHGALATGQDISVGVVGDGTVTVTDAGSHWQVSDAITVGGGQTSGVGAGTMSILNGGLVTSNGGEIGGGSATATGALTIDGAGSTWTAADIFLVGGVGTGTLVISNGGLLSDNVAGLGFNAGATGTAAIVGAGAMWSGSELQIGTDGVGKLVLSSGGTVATTTSLDIAVDTGSTGTLVIGAEAANAAASPGTVTSPEILFGSGQGSIVFNHTSGNYAFSPQIQGVGTIDQVAGITSLTGDASAFGGAVSVQGGILLVDDTLGTGAASVFVQSGGTLGGTGTILAPVSVAGGGTLMGKQGQTLTLDSLVLGSAANLDVSLGAPGGTALFAVNHNLTLDGTLDIHALSGFGPGIYRLMTYGGTLTDQGLTVGTVPGGTQASDYAVQTSVPFQINLVDLAASNRAFWDGDGVGSANNHLIDGGAGTWSVTAGNWTDVNGATDGAMSPQPGFAVFEGAPGLVTVDDSAGAVAVDGMQFAVDGYHVAGNAISLADPASVIRVGDGTSAGAGYTATIGSALAGTGGLVKSDLGTLVLTGANTYTGDTDVVSGTLQLDAGGSLSSPGGTLFVAGNPTDPAGSVGTVNLTNGGAIQAMQSIVIGAPVNSTGILQVSGSGSTVTAGTLDVGQGGMGSLFIVNGGVVTAPQATLGSSTGGSGAVVVDGAGSQWLTSGLVTIADQGDGVLTLQNGGVAEATTAVIGAQGVGTVNVGDAGSHWQIGGDLVVGGTETTGTGTGNLSVLGGGLVTSTNGLIGATPGSNGALIVSGAGAAWTLSADLGVGWTGAGTVSVSNGGLLSDNVGVIGLGPTGLGVALVDGSASTWSSPTLTVGVNGSGTLILADGGTALTSLGTTIAANAGSTGMLIIGADQVSPAADPGFLTSPTVTFGAGQGSVIFNHTSPNYVFSAAMSGTGVIDQLAGTTRLTGDSSGFAGGASVQGGTLLVDGKLGFGAVTVLGGALGGGGTIGGAVTVAAGGALVGVQGQTLTMDSLALNSGASVNVTLNAPGGAGLFAITHDLTLDGALNVTAGSSFGPGVYRLMTYGGTLTDNGLDIATISDGTPTTDFSVQTSVTGQVNLVDSAIPTLALQFWDGDAAGNAGNSLVDGGSGTWSATRANWTDVNGSANGAMTPQPGFAIFQGAPGTVTVDDTAGTVAVTGMQFAANGYVIQGDTVSLAAPNAIVRVGDGSAAGASYTAAIGSILTGTGGLTKTDLGTLVLTGENTFTGATTITSGTLQLGDGGAGGTGSVAGDIVDNAALVFDNGSLLHNTAGAISGSGSVSVLGLVDLTGTDTYSGGTTVAAGGTLFIGSSSTTGSVVGDITNNGRLGFARTDSIIFQGPISGAGSLEQDGTGTLILTGANGYTGGTTVNQGTLQLGNGGTTGAIVGDVGNSGTLAFDRSDTVSFGGHISGSGSVLQAGAGTTTLAGVNTYGGGTSITGGTLIGQATSFGGGEIHTQSALVLDQATDAVFANVVSGTGTLLKQGAGILTFTGASTFSGPTTIAAGGLSVDGSLAASAVTVQSGASLGGKGTVGAVTVADGGTLMGVQGQSLAMSSLVLGAGAKLDVSLTSPGGAALFTISQDVTLDGTLDLSSPAVFGAGVYRIMDYGGSLTDNGMTIGATPANTSAADLAIQTSVAGQVNLVDTMAMPVTLQFWDGDGAGAANNHAIDGGSGTWSIAGTNWTDVSGAVNGAQAPQPGFAVFEGAPGTVTVDDGPGPVAVTGMQFAGNGYLIQGNAISLSDPDTILRVGDGTASGAGYVATIASSLDGAGGLDKTDLGTLVLTGANSYTGGTTISGGTLVGAVGSFGLGAIHDNAALVVDQASDAVFANAMDGTGTFTKRGAGSLDYTGTGTLTGPTTVAAGRLAVNGSLQASQVTVQNGAILGGNGTVGGIVVQSGGIVAPGNSIGELTVAGNYAQAAGSIYQAQVASTGGNDRITVSGSATLAAGAILDVVKTDTSPFVTGTRYTLLTAAGGVSGTYALTGDVTPTTFSTVVLDYDAHDVYLDITKTASFATAGTTANEKATGGGLDSLTSGNPLYTAILASPDTAAAAAAFDQLSGEIHASVRTTLVEDSRIIRDMALGKLIDTSSQDRGEGMWGEAVGSTGSTDSDGNAAKLGRSTDGIIMGFQHGFDNATQFGLLAGHTRTDVRIAARNAYGTIDGYHLGGYWGAERGPVNIRLGADYAWQDVTTRRGVAFAGFADQLTSRYAANTAEAFADVGYRIGPDRTYLEPYVQAVAIDATTQGVYELGGYAALSADRASTDLGLATLGIRGAARFNLGTADTVLRGGIGWQDALNAKAPDAQIAFSGGNAFDIAGAPIARDALALNAGIDVKVAQRLKLSLTYSGQLAAHAQDNAVKAGFNWRF